ncbi:glycosyltransferase family 4 protein [Thiohalocapsa marina]|uniref:Glycosyltransferase family 4 protein n=1 Tax=Thiohalocapsa marina TaxID=424902 RepID=A0A5M8FU41_9GAMM|nr:glycosyltransferase family 4 protein [Thiohalocapsa marina]KAA6187315.1 glycosyltransferase family 4 protein [Thiohalocapsa marina]
MPRRKRILFLVNSMYAGGAERVASLLSSYWARLGHEVILMPTYSGRGDCVYPLDGRVRLDYLADHVEPGRSLVPVRLRRLWALRRAIRDYSPDVVLAFLTPVNVIAVLASRGLGKRVVLAEHTHPPARRLGIPLALLRRMTYHHAETVVMLTESGRRWLQSCCPRARGKVIPNPVAMPLPIGQPSVAPASILAANRRVLIAVGRLSPEKNLSLLIDAFAKLAGRFSDWDLVLLGEGPEHAALERRSDAHGLKGRVYFPGRAGNVADWFRRADLFALSSDFEGFPNSLLEAMAHGLPAVSRDCKTGPREIIRHGVDGLLVEMNAGSAELARTLAILMSDSDKRIAMGRAATDVRERFGLARIAALWDGVLGLNT